MLNLFEINYTAFRSFCQPFFQKKVRFFYKGRAESHFALQATSAVRALDRVRQRAAAMFLLSGCGASVRTGPCPGALQATSAVRALDRVRQRAAAMFLLSVHARINPYFFHYRPIGA